MKIAPGHLAKKVEQAVAQTWVDDIHTHLYDPGFGDLLLWGIDELLVYHYLVAEGFRYLKIPYEDFWKCSKREQADLIWDQLFLQHSPLSESCRGVLTTLQLLGLDNRKRDLPAIRRWFAERSVRDFTDQCMETAKVGSICMTNSPFDDSERPVWEQNSRRDPRFKAALRIDPLLTSWQTAGPRLVQWGYKVKPELGLKTMSEIRRFLADWSAHMKPEFLMVSLAPDFEFPDDGPCAQIIEKAVLPHCREFDLPFALMPGVRRAVNPRLQLAGDGVGKANLQALQNLLDANPKNKFLCTILARENQHELCVVARKFRNLHIFGCWWFTNIPSLIDEITRMRLELLGLSFTVQHSDARVLDQILYKWQHSREIISRILIEKYEQLNATGWEPSTAEIERDVRTLFGGSYRDFRALNL